MIPTMPSVQESLAAMVEFSDDAMMGLTVDGIVTSWNDAAARMYGFAATDMIGRSVLDIVPAELHDLERRRLAAAAGGTRVGSVETSRARRDGTRLAVSLSLFPVPSMGRSVSGIVAIERDLTQQHALESQLLQAKRMEAVGRLVGGVAQEFNNINTAILGLVEFVGERLPDRSEARADLNEITKQAMRASRLARHLLAFGGRPALAAHPVSLDDLLHAMEPLLGRLASEGVWLSLDLAHDGAHVLADESQLEMIVFDLLVNASHTVGDRGTILLSTRTRVIGDTSLTSRAGVPNGEYVELTVRDSGPSFGSRSGSGSGSGSGAGNAARIERDVSMVSGVIHQLGGYLLTSTTEPSDTEVSVFLPLAAASETERAPAEASVGDVRGNETILVVEDENAVRDVIVRGLRANGYNVIEARSGEDALAVAGDYAAPMHLVVSDVVMPQMDGRELFDHVRAWYPHIRFLFISGYTRGVITGQQLQGPFTGFLAKPFSVDDLCAKVRSLLDATRPPDEP